MYMNRIEKQLCSMRKATDDHVKELEKNGNAGTRYTAMMPNIPFLILGLLSDVGWMIQLIFGCKFLWEERIISISSVIVGISIIGLITGVVYLIYLNKINEKSIATGFQKNFSFGAVVLGGGLGIAAPVYSYILNSGMSMQMRWILIGGLLNFVTSLPIYLSFKKGIYYGVK